MAFDDVLLRRYLTPITPALRQAGVTDLVVNQPGAFLVERHHVWSHHAAPELTPTWLETLARAAAAASAQDVDDAHPICSTHLPDGERCQIVLPPAAAHVSLTIRRPTDQQLTLDDLAGQGLFDRATVADGVTARRSELDSLYRARDWRGFLAAAVQARCNILISGATGSGKTTLAKALGAQIARDERLITLEDVAEFALPHANQVRLFYAKSGQGLAKVGPKDLLESALRMRPDRVLLQELRDGAAYTYLRNVASGHPGAITTVHAGGVDQAFAQLCLLVKEAPEAASLSRAEVEGLLRNLIDVVVQIEREPQGRRVSEIWFGRR